MTLSLRVALLNAGLSKEGIVEGLALPGCVRSVEDHGYTVSLGIKVKQSTKDETRRLLTA